MKKAILLLLAVMILPGCAMMGEPCEEKWTKSYNAKGQVMYVLEESNCVSIKSKEIYQ